MIKFQLSGLIADPAVLATAVHGWGATILALTPEVSFAAVPAGVQGAPGGEIIVGRKRLPAQVSERCLAATGKIGWIDADFVGGLGEQWAMAWQGGAIVVGPVYTHNHGQTVPHIKDWAINQVLREFGVVARAGADEFDTVRLGRLGRGKNPDRFTTRGLARG
jgi:hypothetical protein